ncbi:hypothetical protein PVAG01_00750 [Phlyctema vagabunda]|uniref:Uncharacterized protein n=1 Tax=Phlyctema vagabunda TaxID=108571 RepID=A0ABR4PVG3_9HELO
MAHKPGPQTPYARKYGVLYRDDPNAYEQYFMSRGKSGFTPVTPLSIAYRTGGERNLRNFVEEAQLYWLRGFTARELYDMGAYPDDEAQPSSLTNPIIEFLDIDHWYMHYSTDTGDDYLHIISDEETRIDPKYSYGVDQQHPHSGKWSAHNPVVWDILEPCLRLASRFLEKFHEIPWVEDFIFGEWIQVDRNRTAQDHRDVEKAVKDVFFKKLIGNLELQIDSGLEVPRPAKRAMKAMPLRNVSWSGFCFIPKNYGGWNPSLVICLAQEMLSPFLQSTMGVSEKLFQQFRVALSIIHEISFFRENPQSEMNHVPITFEAFYEDENDAELGYSLENALLGGRQAPVAINACNRLTIAMFLISWPSEYDTTRFVPARGRSLDDTKIIPVISKYFEYIARDEFWDQAINQFGLEATRPLPTKQQIILRLSSTSQKKVPAKLLDYRAPDWGLRYNRSAQKVKECLSMTSKEQTAYLITQKIKDKNDEIMRHHNVRREQARRSQLIWSTLAMLSTAWSLNKTSDVWQRQELLLTYYEQEAAFQSYEITRCASKVGKMEPEILTEYREALLKLNRELRSLVSELALDVKRSNQILLMPRLLNLENGVKTAHVILHIAPLGPYGNTDIASLFYTPALLEAEDATDQQKAEAKYIQALTDADNLRNTNEAACQNICLDMVWDLGLDEYRRALFCAILGSLEIEKRRHYFSQYSLTILNIFKQNCPPSELGNLQNAIRITEELVHKNIQRYEDEAWDVGSYIPPNHFNYDQGLSTELWSSCQIWEEDFDVDVEMGEW